jgi:hypothetical protein
MLLACKSQIIDCLYGYRAVISRMYLISSAPSVAVGPLSEALRSYLSVPCVPISAPYDAIFSVSFGGEYIGIAQLVTAGEINQTTSFIRSSQCPQLSLLARH